MKCKRCGRARRNSVHTRKTQYGYHSYVEPDPEPPSMTKEELIDVLSGMIDDGRCSAPGATEAEVEKLLNLYLGTL